MSEITPAEERTDYPRWRVWLVYKFAKLVGVPIKTYPRWMDRESAARSEKRRREREEEEKGHRKV